MTLDEMKQSDLCFLRAADVSDVLGVNPHSIRVQAHEDTDKLGFPACVIGNRVLIPRIPFIHFIEGVEESA